MTRRSIASRLAEWERSQRISVDTTPPPGTPSSLGVPFLTAVYGANSRLIVEWAPGADLTQLSQTWSWIDISSDVMQAGGAGINISPIGRSDEYSQAQPAGCSFRLKNFDGRYSKGPQSTNYPNIKRNVPIRVRVDLGTGNGPRVRFQGYSTSWKPTWDVTGNFSVVDLTANGITRRLSQGNAPIESPLRYYIETTTTPLVGDYWPMEDSVGSVQISGGLSNTIAANVSGVTFASYTGISGSRPLPVFTATGNMAGSMSTMFTDNQWQVDFHCFIPSDPGSDTTVLTFNTSGSVNYWTVIVKTGGNINIQGSTNVGTSSTLVVNSNVASSITPFGVPIHFEISVQQSGGNTNYTWVVWQSLGGPKVNVGTTSSYSGTAGTPTRWSVPASANLNGFAIGHLTIYDAYNFTQAGDPAFGWNTEGPTDRLTRLTDQIGIEFISHTDAGGAREIMGAQTTDSFMNIVREVETTDQGIVYDGVTAGLSWLEFTARENPGEWTNSWSVDVSQDQIANGLTPYDDDQRNRNYYTVSRKNGSSAVWQDSTSPLGDGPNGIGRYESSLTINTSDDTSVLPLAQWLVHVGTDDSPYRFASIDFNFANVNNAVNASAWNDTNIGTRIFLRNISTFIPGLFPIDDSAVVVEGWTEFLSPFAWNVTVVCGPEQPWRVIELAADVGDTNEYICHLDADDGDITLAGEYPIGATSLTVNINRLGTGLSVTTDADSVPFPLNIGGWPVTVTSVAAASGSTQVLTVNPTPAPLHNSAHVTIWKPPVLARP